MHATITSKGQITFPIQIRTRLNLLPGQRLEFDERAPFLKAIKPIDRSRTQLARGVLASELANVSNTDAIDALRGPAAACANRSFQIFLIGAHALIDCDALIAFDRRYLRTMFKQLQVIVPMIDAIG